MNGDWGKNDPVVAAPSGGDDWGAGDAAIQAPQQKAMPEPGFLSSKVGRLLQGAGEPIVGLGQLAAHATGFGKDYMDQLAQSQAETYAQSRAAAGIGPNDWDIPGTIGNIASPINYLPGGILGRVAGPAARALKIAAPTTRMGKLAAQTGRGMTIGAGFGAMQPVTNLQPDETYAGEKFGQTTSGALTGAIAEPLMIGAEKLVRKVTRPLYKEGRLQSAANRMGTLLAEGGERPEDVIANLQRPGAQGTVAEASRSPTIAGIEQRLEANDPVFAQRMERQRGDTRAGLEGNTEAAIEGGPATPYREQAVAETRAAQGIADVSEHAAEAEYQKQMQMVEEELAKTRQNAQEHAAQVAEQARGQFGAREGELGAQEIAARERAAQIADNVDQMVSETEQHARNVASKFAGHGPEARDAANSKATEVANTAYESAKKTERQLWGVLPKEDVISKDGFTVATNEAKKYMGRDPLPESIQRIIDGWDNNAITVGEALTDRSNLLAMARAARSGANPDRRLAAISDTLANGILNDLSDVEGADVARNFSRALHDRFSKGYVGELLRLRDTGESAIRPELSLTKAAATKGQESALRMKELEEAAKPLQGKTDDLSSQMREAQEEFLRINAEKFINPGTGMMDANLIDRYLRDNRELVARYPGMKEDLEAAALASRNVGEAKTGARTTKAEQRTQLTQTLGEISAERQALKRASFDKLVSPETGLVKHSRVDGFLRENAATLDRFPGLEDEIRNAANSSRTLEEMQQSAKNHIAEQKATYSERMANVKEERDKIAKSAFAKVAAVEDPATVIGSTLRNSSTPVADLQELARIAKRGGDESAAGFRRLLFEQGAKKVNKDGTLDFQALHDFYFKPLGNNMGSISSVMRMTGVAKQTQIDQLREILESGIAHQTHREGARAIDRVITPIGVMLDTLFRNVGAHYGALLTGTGIYGASTGARVLSNALGKIPLQRMEDVIKEAIESPQLMTLLLQRITNKSASKTSEAIRSHLIRAGILPAVDFSNRRPPSQITGIRHGSNNK